MATSKPRQKRSRDRVEKILLAAGDELARSADADALTTTSVSKRSGIPVATIYRYFADRSAIISTLIDRELAEVDEEITRHLMEHETVTFEVLFEEIMGIHIDYFRSSRRSIVLWFGARNSKEVLKRIGQRYKTLGDWLFDGALKTGMIHADSPRYGGELIVWTCDRGFEFMFREDRDRETQDEILELTIRAMLKMVLEFSTERGREGISSAEFAKNFGPLPPTGV